MMNGSIHTIRQAADRGIDRLDRSDELASATATVVDCEILFLCQDLTVKDGRGFREASRQTD